MRTIILKKYITLYSALLAVTLMLITTQAQAQIVWQGYSKAAFQQAQASKKLVLIYGYSPRCQYCQNMNKYTFTDARVINRINIKYIPVKVNTLEDSATANYYGIFIIPTIVIVKPDGRVVGAVYGYQDPEELLSKI